LVKYNKVLTQFYFQVFRNINLAREIISVIAHNANNIIKSFVKKVLQTYRGNIQDVDRGVVFRNLMVEHDPRDEDLEPSIAEGLRVQPSHYDWLDQLIGTSMQVKWPRHHCLTLRTHTYRRPMYGRPAEDRVRRRPRWSG
jgi:hypothetical protein